MVWCLSPIDHFPGARAYYFFSNGTYTIGRKGCHVTIQSDPGISREHAKLIVAMAHGISGQNALTNFPTDVLIEDCSKYGTYVNKEPGSAKVKDLPDRQTSLRNGDILSFGSVAFRFHYVPLLFFIYGRMTRKANRSLEDILLSIGANFTHKWDSGCTHVLADESSTVTVSIVEAVAARKPVIHVSWPKVLAENRGFEFPSYSTYCLSMMLEGVVIKIVEPEAREKCLKGYVFVLGPPNLYMFGASLQTLISVCGGSVLSINDVCMGNQTVPDRAGNIMVFVDPVHGGSHFNHSHTLNSLSTVDEIKLVCAALSGHLDTSVIKSSCCALSPSNSTNETIVPDSDAEPDTAGSGYGAAKCEENLETLCDQKVQSPEELNPSCSDCGSLPCEKNVEVLREQKIQNLEDFKATHPDSVCDWERNPRKEESMISDCPNSDVIYNQSLIVRSLAGPTTSQSRLKQKDANFKCFRKKEILSGNSFKCLIPFSSDPYKGNINILMITCFWCKSFGV